MLGTALTNFGIGVWAYQKAGNVSDFTWIAIAGALPSLLLTPFAGALADRYSRRKILLFGQIGSMFCTLALVSLFLNNELEIHRIFIIVAISSIFGSFMVPAFSASVPMLVKQEKLKGGLLPGMDADFVILNNNPLEHLENLFDIEAVVINGRFLNN